MIKRKNNNCKKIEDNFNCSYKHHSHIRGLGINNIFKFKHISQGLIGQYCARKAFLIFLFSIKNFDFQKINIIVIGNQETGKTSLSIGIAMSINKSTPFIALNGSELNISAVSRIETITQFIRKTIGIIFHSESFLIEGEIVDIEINKDEKKRSQFYAKLILKTEEIQTTFKIGEKLYTTILQNTIKKGDRIIINKEKNSVEKINLGHIENYENKRHQLNTIKIGNLEKYEVHEHIITLHELDLLNSNSKSSISKFFTNDLKEISNEIREKIDRIMIKWQINKKIKLIKGILLIDEANLLDTESFAYLNKYIEGFISPSIILSANNSNLNLSGTQFKSPYGIPIDFLDRFLVVQTSSYSCNEIENILKLRAKEEMLLVDDEAYKLLIKIGIECGIRYSIYVMCISIIVSTGGFTNINYKDIKKSFMMFVDRDRFTRYTKKLKRLCI
jgi:RuvB-like protein 2